MIKVGIIGGSGLEYPKYLEKVKKIYTETPLGKASSPLYLGVLDGIEVVHLARHGEEHNIPSTKVNYGANIYALKKMDCSFIIATSTCGSLREEICPGEFIVLDQFIDFTKHRIESIFEEIKTGELRYTPMANPFSEDLRDHLIEGAILNGITVHTKGTVITIEGPRFSTRAESNLYRSWKADVINMSTAPEVILSNELCIPYAAISLCTEYDSWRIDSENPSPAEIMEMINLNAENFNKILIHALKKISQPEE
jgi:5'-methylthioadenosine phosphorylase